MTWRLGGLPNAIERIGGGVLLTLRPRSRRSRSDAAWVKRRRGMRGFVAQSAHSASGGRRRRPPPGDPISTTPSTVGAMRSLTNARNRSRIAGSTGSTTDPRAARWYLGGQRGSRRVPGTPPKWVNARRWHAQKVAASIAVVKHKNGSREYDSVMWKEYVRAMPACPSSAPSSPQSTSAWAPGTVSNRRCCPASGFSSPVPSSSAIRGSGGRDVDVDLLVGAGETVARRPAARKSGGRAP